MKNIMKGYKKKNVIISLLVVLLLAAVSFFIVTKQDVMADVQSKGLEITRVDTYSTGDSEVGALAGEANNIVTAYKDISKGRPKIDLTIPKTERESFSIVIKNNAGKSLNDFSVQISDLKNNAGDKISTNYTDARVVYKWDQRNINWDQRLLKQLLTYL